MATLESYYNDSSEWGNYQYILMKDVVNNFMAFYVGDGKVLDSISRYDVIFHAKRGLQELHYDALRDIIALELDVPDDLQLELPRDFVRLIRLSWVDKQGRQHDILNDHKSSMPTAYLQDDDANIIFDDDGNPTTGTSTVDANRLNVNHNAEVDEYSSLSDEFYGGRFGMQTSNANINGTYNIDKNLGIIRFSSNIKAETVVIEYISDGLEGKDESEIRVNKQ